MRRRLRFLTATPVLVLLIVTGSCSSTEDSAPSPDPSTSGQPTSGPSTSDPSTSDQPPSSPADEGARGDEVAALEGNLPGSFSPSIGLTIDEQQASCVAPKWVEVMAPSIDAAEIGAPELAEPRFSPTSLDLDRDQGLAMVDAAVECGIDVRGAYTKTIVGPLDDEQAACFEAAFDDDIARQFVGESLAGPLSPEFDKTM